MSLSRRSFLNAAAVLGLASVNPSAETNSSSVPDYEGGLSDLRLTERKALESIVADQKFILKEAKTADLPPEFLASIIYDHRRDANWLTDLTDKVLSVIGDPSMGEGQIRPSVAARTDGLKEGINFRQHLEYRDMLLKPSNNIYYTAQYLRLLLEKDNRFPGIKAEDLSKNPNAMAIIATEYRSHPTKNSNDKAKPSYYGYRVIAGIAEDSPLYRILGVNLGDSSQLASQYLNQNFSGIIEARKNYDDEKTARAGRRVGIPIATAAGTAGLYLGLKALMDRKNHLKLARQ